MTQEDRSIDILGATRLYAFQKDEIELSSRESEAMYELFVEDMPYGTAKARDGGDPDEFITERLCEIEISKEDVKEYEENKLQKQIAKKNW